MRLGHSGLRESPFHIPPHADFFFGGAHRRAPAACRGARTVVLPMNTASESASGADYAKTRCQTPHRDHRAKR